MEGILDDVTKLLIDAGKYGPPKEITPYHLIGAFLLGRKASTLDLTKINDDAITELMMTSFEKITWDKFSRTVCMLVGYKGLPPTIRSESMDLDSLLTSIIELHSNSKDIIAQATMFKDFYTSRSLNPHTFMLYFRNKKRDIIESLKKIPIYDRIKTEITLKILDEKMEINSKIKKGKSKFIYKDEFKDKYMISFDVKKGNATVFFYLLRTIFGLNDSFEEWDEPYSKEHSWDKFARNACDHPLFEKSKFMRQITMGFLFNEKIDHGRLSINTLIERGERHLINWVYSICEINEEDLLCHMSDEFVIQVDKATMYESFFTMKSKLEGDKRYPWLSQVIHVNLFYLEKIDSKEGSFYVKHLIDPTTRTIYDHDFKQSKLKDTRKMGMYFEDHSKFSL